MCVCVCILCYIFVVAYVAMSHTVFIVTNQWSLPVQFESKVNMTFL